MRNDRMRRPEIRKSRDEIRGEVTRYDGKRYDRVRRNETTQDATEDRWEKTVQMIGDEMIRRNEKSCRDHAKRWGFGGRA